jgi:hypothetical protein
MAFEAETDDERGTDQQDAKDSMKHERTVSHYCPRNGENSAEFERYPVDRLEVHMDRERSP